MKRKVEKEMKPKMKKEKKRKKDKNWDKKKKKKKKKRNPLNVFVRLPSLSTGRGEGGLNFNWTRTVQQ